MGTQTRPVPFLDLKAQVAPLRAEIDAAIADVVDNTAFILGERVESFENKLAKYCEADHCIGVDSGTQALNLILRALDVGEGDEVITVPNTFIATVAAIAYTGATPVFADVDPRTWMMDPDLLENAITPRTKAILPVHLFGNPVDFEPIAAVARKHGLPIVEDACQAHGARYQGRRCGSLGVAAAFSFYPGKNLGAFGDGGAVTTNDADIAERIRSLRHHGQTRKNIHDFVGYTGRLDAIQAVVLSVKLDHLESWNDGRRAVAARYRERLAGKYRMPEIVEGGQAVHHLFPIQSEDPEGLISRLAEAKVFCGRHYPIPCHKQPAVSGLIEPAAHFPVAEELCAGIVSLPMFAEMTNEMVDAVCELLL